MSVALLDGDVIAYKSSVCFEIDWGDSKTGDLSRSIAMADVMIRDWTQKARCQSTIVTLSGEHNFRKTVHPEYKANRSGGKPVVYYELIKYIESNYRIARIPWLEADDVMGIYGTSDRLVDPVIVSIDKDMFTIPTRVLNPDKAQRPRKVRAAEALHNRMMQTLTGDSTDNYKGAKGIGAKKAEAILSNCMTEAAAWQAVLAAYHAAGQTEADALRNARVARILMRPDYNKETQEIGLWHINPKQVEWINPASSASTAQPPKVASPRSRKPSPQPATGSSSSLPESSKGCSATSSSKPDSPQPMSTASSKVPIKKRASKSSATKAPGTRSKRSAPNGDVT